jgi:hypothetical protein
VFFLALCMRPVGSELRARRRILPTSEDINVHSITYSTSDQRAKGTTTYPMSTYLYFRGQVALSHEDLQGYPLYVWLVDELVVKDDIVDFGATVAS